MAEKLKQLKPQKEEKPNFAPKEVMASSQISLKDGFSVTVNLLGSAAATAANYGTFFIAPRACTVRKVKAVWETASTSGTLQIERLTGTTAPGSGTNILASTIDMSGTANTVVSRRKFELTSGKKIKENERLALVDGGTLTSQAMLTVTIYFAYLGNGNYK